MRVFAMVLGLGLGLASVASAQQSEPGTGGTATAPPGDTGTTTGTTGTGRAPTTTAPPPQTQQPPPPQPPPPAPPPREREEPGDGRSADLLWIEGGFGYSWADLVQFSENNFLPSIEQVQGSGWSAQAAAGIRLAFLMIGARGTLSSYEGFDLWTVGGEVHLRIPLGAFEPYVRVGAGYAFMGQVNYDAPKVSEVDVFGLALDAGAGLDIYLDKIVAIGVGIDGAYLNLSRQRVDLDGCPPGDSTCGTSTVSFDEDGDAAGLQLRAHGHISLHF